MGLIYFSSSPVSDTDKPEFQASLNESVAVLSTSEKTSKSYLTSKRYFIEILATGRVRALKWQGI